MPYKILIIEDTVDWLEKFNLLIKEMGHQAELAQNIPTAKQMLTNNVYNLLLVDLCIDGDTFSETCQDFIAWLFKTHPGVPMLITSGQDLPHDIFFKLGQQANNRIDFIAKDTFQLKEFRTKIESLLHSYSVFISYSTKDQIFAQRLYKDLKNNGVLCWFAPEDLEGGKKLHEQIDAAIRMQDRLLLILSENSMNSEWVKTEISKARKKEAKENRRVLFPIRLVYFEEIQEWDCFDADRGKDSAKEIREYFIPDFSQWQDEKSYKAAFDRLLKDLRAKE